MQGAESEMSRGIRRGARAWAVLLPLLLLAPGPAAESVAAAGAETREGVAAQAPPLRIETDPPSIAVVGVETRIEVRVTGHIPASGLALELREAGAERALLGEGIVPAEGSVGIRFTPRRPGTTGYEVILRGPGGARAEFGLRSIPAG